MKKILTILLALAISTSAFGINVTIVNNTNINGGWNANINNLTKNLPNNGTRATFNDVSSNFTIKIVSNTEKFQNQLIKMNIYQTSDENIIIHIKECNSQSTECQQIIQQTAPSESGNEGIMGNDNIYYYLK